MYLSKAIVIENIRDDRVGVGPGCTLRLQTDDGTTVNLVLDKQQASLLKNRFVREYLVLCKEERLLEIIDKAPNYRELEKIAKKYSLCDICDFSDINLYGIKRMLKVVVISLCRYPKLRGKFCYIGSPNGYRKKMQQLASGDMQVLKDFGLQYICRRDIALQLGAMMHSYAGRVLGDHEGYIAMAVSAFGLFDAILFDQNDFEGYAYISLVSSLRKCVESGFHPLGCHTPESVAYHEIGHLVDYLCGLSRAPAMISYVSTLSPIEVRNGLSEYATTSTAELIAEAFAEYMCNDSPRIISRRVCAIIDQEYKKVK